ncbi:MAG TPA: M14 family zinc carboxypeptidase, partial [Ilumatobacteraceae bacterium]|nr:M14 family zinc carboxypeptidase [Ilumatobacteraceae bacterium]
MSFQRLIAGAGITAVVAATLVAGAAPANALERLAASPIVTPISSLVEPPTSYPSQPLLPTVPDDPTDASIARGVTPYDEIAPFLNSLMAQSDRISAQVVGQSTLGRDIHLVTLTAKETKAQTAKQKEWRELIKADPAAAATNKPLQNQYKVPIWFNGNIHGNEWEGTDGILNYIDYLATAPWPEVRDLLQDYRFYFTVTNNPDGRALGQRANADGFDINRDMITGATPESRIIRDLSSVIQPTFFVDLHGYTNVLQIEPCGPPHGENYEYDLFLPHAYAAALEIEQAVVDADIPGNTYLDRSTGQVTQTNTGNIRIPYRDIRSGWDDWPPIFTPQYVAYQGAITNTVELPLGRTNNQATNQANSKVNIEVAGVVIETAVDYVADHADALLQNQIEIFRRGTAGEPLVSIPADVDPAAVPAPNQWAEVWDETDVYTAEFPRAYVIPVDETQRSVTDAANLVDQLIANGVEVSRAQTSFTAGGTAYAEGSYVVDMHQPLRGMANVLLADGS